MNCYGTYTSREECRDCSIANYCRAQVENDKKGELGPKRSDAMIESVAALERFSELPEVYQTPAGNIGYAFHAVGRMCSYLLQLSPAALRLLRQQFRHPEWQEKQLARALKVTTRTIRAKKKEIFSKMQPSEFFVFIAGPMTGLPDWNRAEFYAAEEQLTELNCEAINPAQLAFIIPEYASHEFFTDVTCAMVPHCHALIRLPGWEQSKGARLEIAAAARAGVPVFNYPDQLPELKKLKKETTEK